MIVIKNRTVPCNPRSENYAKGTVVNVSGSTSTSTFVYTPTYDEIINALKNGKDYITIPTILEVYGDLYSLGEVSAFGAGSGSSGSGLIQTVYGLSGLGGSYSNATLTDTFNAYAINSLYNRINSLEAGSAIEFITAGNGNAVTSVIKSGVSVIVTKGLTFSVDGHTHTFAGLTSKPTTLSGYGITDALNLSGGTLSGNLFIPNNAAVIQNQASTSNYTAAIKWYKGGVSQNIYDPQIGQYNEGGGTGSIVILPYSTNIDPWIGTVGLYLAESVIKFNNNTIYHSGNFTNLNQLTTRNFSDLQNKPTTLGGYGITDAVNSTTFSTHVSSNLHLTQAQRDVLALLSVADGKLKASADFYSVGEVSAFGAGAGSGGSGLIQTVYGYAGLGGTYSDATLTDTFNAYTINRINTDLSARIASLESGSAIGFTTTGSGNAVTSVTKSGTSVTVTKGLTFSVDGHTHTFASLTSKPTTLSGYGITDGLLASAYTATDVLNKIKTVDGAGSGLDADYLRGYEVSVGSNTPFNTIPVIHPSGWMDIGVHLEFHYDNVTASDYSTVLRCTGNYSNIVLLPTSDGTLALISDNVASATKLQTSRTIAGVNFDGTANISIPFANLSSIPTTLSGYGITDAYTQSQINGLLALKLDIATFSDLFEKVNIGTELSPIYAIKAKYNFYSVGEVSAFGAGAGSGGSGLIQTVYGYAGLGGTYSDATLTDTFNAYTINRINTDLSARIASLEAGSAIGFTTAGSGNAVTSVTKSGTSVTVTKGLTFSVDGHTHTFASLTSKPTTLSGYGITDAYTTSSADNTFLKKSGGTMTGALDFSGTERNISGVNRFYVTDWTDFQLFEGTEFSILDSTTYKYLFKVTAGSTTVEMPDATALKISNNTVWHSGNDGSGSGLDADLLDGYHNRDILARGIYPRAYYTDSTNLAKTVGTVKAQLKYILGANGALSNATISGSLIDNWNNESAIGYDSSIYNVIRLDGYGTASYGQYLFSSYDLTNIKVAGVNNGVWTDIKTLAFTTDNVASATKLQTTRTIWGQSFDGSGNVDGAMSGVTNITMSGALSGGTTSSFSSYSTANRFYTGYDSDIANSISCSGWFRSNGTSGWVNATYGGGITMEDSTYVKVYNNKSFWVNNNIVATGEITAFGASDIRLKDNVKPISSALDFLGKVKTYEFDWNDKALSLNPLKTKKGAGVIAQEMQSLDSDFVHSIYGEYLGVDYDRFIPYLIKGVNEVSGEVAELKRKVKQLETKLNELQN